MLYLDCPLDALRLTEHRGTHESEPKKKSSNEGVLPAVRALRERCAQSLYRTIPKLLSGVQYCTSNYEPCCALI